LYGDKSQSLKVIFSLIFQSHLDWGLGNRRYYPHTLALQFITHKSEPQVSQRLKDKAAFDEPICLRAINKKEKIKKGNLEAAA